MSQANTKNKQERTASRQPEARESQKPRAAAPAADSAFARDVAEGLSGKPKRLSSKYFYDKRGDALFQAIMKMPEYYLTRAEFEILEMHRDVLQRLFMNSSGRFNLIEFGAGDGFKTKILLRHFTEAGVDFKYVPIDISENVLEILTEDLQKNIPELKVQPICNDYFKARVIPAASL